MRVSGSARRGGELLPGCRMRSSIEFLAAATVPKEPPAAQEPMQRLHPSSIVPKCRIDNKLSATAGAVRFSAKNDSEIPTQQKNCGIQVFAPIDLVAACANSTSKEYALENAMCGAFFLFPARAAGNPCLMRPTATGANE